MKHVHKFCPLWILNLDSRGLSAYDLLQRKRLDYASLLID